MADMTVTRDALLLLISQVPATDFCATALRVGAGCLAPGLCSTVAAVPAATAPFGALPTPANPCTATPAADVRNIAGAGWVTADFRTMPGGSPIASLPVDPVNTGSFFYGFRADAARTFRLVTRLESLRHRVMMRNDGGPRSACAGDVFTGADCFYEVGTNMVAGF